MQLFGVANPLVQAQAPAWDYNSTLSPALCAHMIIGINHKLHVSRTDPDTIWLSGHVGETNNNTESSSGNSGSPAEIPLPFDEAPQARPGDEVDVFVYSDAQANPVATTKTPIAILGECACLKVRSTTELGAFLDWGIGKDLFLPFSEQRRPVQEGAKECVLVYLDNSGRLAASSRLDNHLVDTDEGFEAWQKVSLLIYQRTDLGFKAVINNRAIGLLYKDEIFSDVKVGQSTIGYIKRLRPDHRIDVALQPTNDQVKTDLTDTILQHINQHDGILLLTDKSAPEEIYSEFGVSKKNFKRALSALYKQRKIVIEADRVLLASKGS